MKLFRKTETPLCRVITHTASIGTPALWLTAIHSAELHDQDLPRLVATARDLGLRAVRVDFTGTPRQCVVLTGFPMVRAIMRSENLSNVALVDALTEVAS